MVDVNVGSAAKKFGRNGVGWNVDTTSDSNAARSLQPSKLITRVGPAKPAQDDAFDARSGRRRNRSSQKTLHTSDARRRMGNKQHRRHARASE